MAKAVKPNFTPNPGNGWLFEIKRGPGVRFYQGSFALESGERTLVKATAHADTKHYEFEIQSLAKATMWKQLAAFNMPAFGKVPARTVAAGNLGSLRIWPAVTPNGRHCIRVRLNSAALTEKPM